MKEETTHEQSKAEPWLRGSHNAMPPVQRGVLHALELAREDIAKWCGGLNEEQLHARPSGLPSVAFQLRHIAQSLDRFFTYAEGAVLSEPQRAALAGEADAQGSRDTIQEEFHLALRLAEERLEATFDRPLETAIKIGRKGLPTTLGGLLVHVADHTQRHVGQAITTAKLVAGPKTLE